MYVQQACPCLIFSSFFLIFPDFILILSWFCPGFSLILFWFYPYFFFDFILTLPWLYPDFILILPLFFKKWIKIIFACMLSLKSVSNQNRGQYKQLLSLLCTIYEVPKTWIHYFIAMLLDKRDLQIQEILYSRFVLWKSTFFHWRSISNVKPPRFHE